MERLSNGAIEEILAFRDQVEQKAENVSRSVKHDTNVMEDICKSCLRRDFLTNFSIGWKRCMTELRNKTAWSG